MQELINAWSDRHERVVREISALRAGEITYYDTDTGLDKDEICERLEDDGFAEVPCPHRGIRLERGVTVLELVESIEGDRLFIKCIRR